MAKTVSVVITDDLDGTPGAEAVTFSLGGTSYEIDLAEQNAGRLRATLQPYLAAGRRITQPRQASQLRQPRAALGAGPEVDRAAVRAWAAGQGLQVSARGRISAEVMAKYEAAH